MLCGDAPAAVPYGSPPAPTCSGTSSRCSPTPTRCSPALADVTAALLDRFGVDRHAPYVHGHGTAIGRCLALRAPARITGIVTQNGNACPDRCRPCWGADDEVYAPAGARGFLGRVASCPRPPGRALSGGG